MTDSVPEPLSVPPRLAEGMRRFGSAEWLDSLPKSVGEAAERWDLEIGEPYVPGGMTSWVAPVRRGDGLELALKVTWAHDEGLHEAEGLMAWDGRGAIRLFSRLEVDGARIMLLERCRPGLPLDRQPETEQDEVVAGLLHRLWSAPRRAFPFRPLSEMCDRWVAEFRHKQSVSPHSRLLDPGLVEEGLALFGDLARSADRAALLCTDLHAGNVLAARREPWLMIDPKPYLGDPTYDVLQHLVNCPGRLLADPRATVRRLADLVDLDPERIERWLFARCVIESLDREDLRRVARLLIVRA